MRRTSLISSLSSTPPPNIHVYLREFVPDASKMTVSSEDYEALLQDSTEESSKQEDNFPSLQSKKWWLACNRTSKFHPALLCLFGVSILTNLFFTWHTLLEATSQSGRSHYGKQDATSTSNSLKWIKQVTYASISIKLDLDVSFESKFTQIRSIPTPISPLRRNYGKHSVVTLG